MNLLIDTSILIWVLSDSSKLTSRTRQMIQEADKNFISSISIAEIEIKKTIGKLTIPGSYIKEIFASGFEELHFDFDDAHGLQCLPLFHKDPFDRMLISQAIAKGLTLLTSDTVFKKYNVPVLLNSL